MSQYINFFISHKDEKKIPFVDYPRSNILYSYLNAPYGKVQEYKDKDLIYFSKELDGEINELQERIKYLEEDYVQAIAQMNNSIEDKLDAIYQAKSEVEEIKNTIKEYKAAQRLLLILADCTWNDNKVFAGIEVSEGDYSPSLE